MRHIFLALLLLFASMSAACQFVYDFVVINATEQPIEITYRIGGTNDEPLAETGRPAVLAASEVSSGEWRELSLTQYVLDKEKRTVKVSIPTGTALRIYQGRESEPRSATDFIIKEVSIRGANGELVLKGDQVYKSFIAVPKPFFSFGPSTLMTLTYK